MNTKLVSFNRSTNPYKLTLMVDDSIYKLLKDYSKDHRLTMSCIVENLIYSNLGGDSHGTTKL
ncbi:hypothetical protein [uncultured Ilyobacter sp.]|uniref:hypothetical protein n=1 Tax=uncultured Ilyobacter sp. TaxID=544433 RepID=UPI002AA93256|nr:hypothetical protein [uncultured Ilyobacter sp.]